MKEIRKVFSKISGAVMVVCGMAMAVPAHAGLTYSTYLGTTVEDRAHAIAVDADGNVYVTGQTTTVADAFPGTAGHFQSANAGGVDAFVIKITSAGAIEWATYLGGAGEDIGRAIAVDGVNGKVYITGSTTSSNFPTSGAYQAANGGGFDTFITAIAATGNSLVYSTYLGGAGIDVGLGIAVDSSGNAYVTGGMTSDNTTRAATAGAYQTNNGGPGGAVENAFVAKFNSAGGIGYFTYLGGSVTGGTHGNAIAIDGTGNAYVTGACRDTFPTFPSGVLPLARAFKLTIGGAKDAFVSKISPSGANLLYSSYLGGSGLSEGYGIKVDGTGNVYVTGDTNSTDFPDATTDGITVGFPKVGQTTIVGNFDTFVFKIAMNATGHSDGVYCTFLGGSGLDHVNALALDSYGDAYVTGRTESGDFLTAGPGSIQTPIETVQNGTAKAFVTVIGPAGNTRVLNTYIGGVTDQEGKGIGLDAAHSIYVAGWTNSSGFPTAGSAPMPLFSANAGSYDAFVLKIAATSPPPASPPTVTSVNPTLGTELGGTTVAITGTGFTNVTSVQFGGTNAFSYTVASATVITAVSPAHAAGTVDIVVTTTAGASPLVLADNFLYIPVAGPTLTTMSPTLGATTGGTTVLITGTGLTGVTLVTFGGVSAFSFVVSSSTLITAVSPAHVAGVVDVVVTNQYGASPIVTAGQFLFFTPPSAPTISSVTPTLGTVLGGTTVAITGTGFTNVTSVQFGGVNAFSYTVASATVITAVSPAHAAGDTDIVVTNDVGPSANVVADNYVYTPVAGPTLTTLSPTLGATTGGTTVLITGTGLTGVTLVTFGGVNAFSFLVNSDTLMTVTTSTHVAGVVDVVVTNPFGSSPIVTEDQFLFFTPASAPTISSVTPTLGAITGGTTVAITGTGFSSVTSVQFGGINAFSYTVASATVITAVSPAHAVGDTDIVVTNIVGPSSNTAADNFVFTLVAPAAGPTLTALSPLLGVTAGGTTVALTGTGLTGVTLVTFGGVNAFSFLVNSDTLITSVSPTHVVGVVDVRVTNALGTSPIVAGDQFTYFTPALPPSITSVSPTLGAALGGTTVAITGTGFASVTSVQFGGVNAFSYTVASTTVITAVSPAHAAGAVDIVVTNSVGASSNTSADNFVYIAPSPGPTLTALGLTFGATTGGTTVAITGTGLTGVTLVTFGGVNAFSFLVSSATLITAISPVHAAGVVDVVVSNALGTSPIVTAGQFAFITAPSAPTLTAVTPTSGSVLGGSTVSITGTGFASVTSVQFGDVNAFSYTVASATLITAVSPAHAAGTVDIVVTTVAGPSPNTAADNFVYTPVIPAAGPTLTAIAPTFGTALGGTVVSITGTGLTGVTLVTFGGTKAFSFIVNADTLMTAISPGHTAGVVDVVVTNPLGTSPTVNADRFTYLAPAPVITGLTPILGTIKGGTSVAIAGTGLTGVTLVAFGGIPAPSFVVNSDNLITAISPTHAAGTVDVRATNPVSTTPVVTVDQFTFFTPAPVITGLSPALGATSGGTTVAISGTGFTGVTGGAGVRFGGVNAASYVVVSDTRISAVSPTHTVGVVDLVVTAPVGPSPATSASQFTYFFIPAVSLGVVAPFDPYVFPSPANQGTVSVAYYLASSGSMKVRFYNKVGRLVGTLNESGKSAGANASVFDVSDWAPGVYYSLLTVNYDDGTSTKHSRVKFVVIR